MLSDYLRCQLIHRHLLSCRTILLPLHLHPHPNLHLLHPHPRPLRLRKSHPPLLHLIAHLLIFCRYFTPSTNQLLHELDDCRHEFAEFAMVRVGLALN